MKSYVILEKGNIEIAILQCNLFDQTINHLFSVKILE